MAIKRKIDSSVVGLRYAEETVDIGVLPGSPTWIPLEPNSFGDFGVEITTLSRDPISDDRQSKQGMVTDLEASGGFQSDLTQSNLQNIMQGFMFADLRLKPEFGNGSGVITSVTTTYNAASGLGVFLVGRLVIGKNFVQPGNNGLHRVTTTSGTALTVTPALTAEATPPASAQLVEVGVQAGSADINVDVTGAFYALTSTTLNFTLLGLNIGEWVYVGGDSAPVRFVTAGNNGWKRIKTIAAQRLEFDKSITVMSNETGTGLTIQLFYGRVLKNETGSLIKRRTYNLERTLGAPDTAQPTQIQSEYLEGAVANKLACEIGVADKVMCDLEFLACTGTTRTGLIGVKTGTRPNLVEQDAFNTSSDFTFLMVSAAPTVATITSALFGFMTEFKFNVNNNAKLNKAIGTLGAIEVTVGKFKVDGEITAYFTQVDAIEAVKANTAHTAAGAMVKKNSGITFDMPLLTLGNARLNIEQDQEITIPCKFDAASGAQVNASLDHTLQWGFYDYLPTAAES